MSGKRNQRRGKQQEYRLIEALENMDDVEVLKYYGQREGKAGDVLARVGKHQVRFDHKSSADDVTIRLQKDWMVKLTGINLLRMDEEGAAIPAISFSIYGKRGLYVMTRRILGAPHISPDRQFGKTTQFKSCPITSGMLNDYDLIRISFDGYCVSVVELDHFIERIKHDG